MIVIHMLIESIYFFSFISYSIIDCLLFMLLSYQLIIFCRIIHYFLTNLILNLQIYLQVKFIIIVCFKLLKINLYIIDFKIKLNFTVLT